MPDCQSIKRGKRGSVEGGIMIGGEDKMKLMKRDKQGYYGATKVKWLTVWELKLQHFAKNIMY